MGWLTVGKQFIKPFTKTGAKSVSKWKSGAAKANLEYSRFKLKETFKKTDTSLKKLEKTIKKQKKILED
jgi:hypothetical protein